MVNSLPNTKNNKFIKISHSLSIWYYKQAGRYDLSFFVGGIYVFKQMGIQAKGQSKDCPFCVTGSRLYVMFTGTWHFLFINDCSILSLAKSLEQSLRSIRKSIN